MADLIDTHRLASRSKSNINVLKIKANAVAFMFHIHILFLLNSSSWTNSCVSTFADAFKKARNRMLQARENASKDLMKDTSKTAAA